MWVVFLFLYWVLSPLLDVNGWIDKRAGANLVGVPVYVDGWELCQIVEGRLRSTVLKEWLCKGGMGNT